MLRGVTLGLFDEAAAMEKFTKWSTDHDSEFAKRQETHKKTKAAARPVFVKKAEPIKAAAPEVAHEPESGDATDTTEAKEATEAPGE